MEKDRTQIKMSYNLPFICRMQMFRSLDHQAIRRNNKYSEKLKFAQIFVVLAFGLDYSCK